MSHGDQLSQLPADFHVIGQTGTAPFAAIAHNTKPFYGIQFHPEVTHSTRGKEVIGRFILNICKSATNWTMVVEISSSISSANAVTRKNLLVKKLRGSEKSAAQQAVSSEPSAGASTAPLLQSLCTKLLGIGNSSHPTALS